MKVGGYEAGLLWVLRHYVIFLMGVGLFFQISATMPLSIIASEFRQNELFLSLVIYLQFNRAEFCCVVLCDSDSDSDSERIVRGKESKRVVE